MEPVRRGSDFLYLADGRLFVRNADGTINEADAMQRHLATALLELDQSEMIDPARGLEIAPPAVNRPARAPLLETWSCRRVRPWMSASVPTRRGSSASGAKTRSAGGRHRAD